MAKNQIQKQQFEDAARSFLEFVTNSSPVALVAGLCLSFGVLAFWEADYYATINAAHFPASSSAIGCAVAAVFFIVRFSLGLSAANNFYDGKAVAGVVTAVLSLGAAVFQTTLSGKMALAFASPDLQRLIEAVIWGGYLMEFGLYLMVASHRPADAVKPQQQPQPHNRQPNQQQPHPTNGQNSSPISRPEPNQNSGRSVLFQN